jgi:hypothetical protein
MSYYDALVSLWATLPAGDTTDQKLAAVNAMTVAGSKQDVPVGEVVGYLALQGKLSALQDYAAAKVGAAQPVMAARELVTLLATPSVTSFRTSDPAAYATISGFLTALAGDANSGITSADAAALLALAAGPAITWCRANGYPDAAPNIGGGGLTMIDLEAAGLN